MVSDRTLEARCGLAPRTVALWGDLIRAVTTAAAALLVAGMTAVYVRTVQNTIDVRHLQDFGVFYDSALALAHGANLYAPPMGKDTETEPAPPPNLNPPHFHLLIWPFTYLSPPAAFVVWIAVSISALAVSLLIICRTLDLAGWSIAVLCAFAYLWTPMFATLFSGQVGLVLMLPFTIAWAMARRSRSAAAGAWLGVCGSIKPPLLLFIPYFVAAGRRRAAIAASILCAAAFLAGVAIAGVRAHAEWVHNLTAVRWIAHYLNASVLALIERALPASQWQRPLWLIAIAVIVVATLRRVVQRSSIDQQFLLVTAAALLVSPISWIYYLWFLLPPLTARLASSAPLARGRVLLAGAMAGFLVPPSLPWMTTSMPVAVMSTAGSVYSWSLLAVWTFAMADVDEREAG